MKHQKKIADFDRLGLLAVDHDESDSSELEAGKIVSLGKALERVIGEPLVVAVARGREGTRDIVAKRTKEGSFQAVSIPARRNKKASE